MTTVARRPGRIADVLGWLDESAFTRRGGLGLMQDVRIEDYVEDGAYVLCAEIPGIDPDKDLDVYIEGDMLVVQGERREEKRDKHHQELHYGSFERAVRLPDGAVTRDLSATYVDGVLKVRIPLDTEVHATARHKIPVQRPES